jgi:hypothetical protein
MTSVSSRGSLGHLPGAAPAHRGPAPPARAPRRAQPVMQEHTGPVTVVVTEIAWDGRIRRRALDTCSLTDAGHWQAQHRRAARPTATSPRVRYTESTAGMGHVDKRLSDGEGHRERAPSRRSVRLAVMRKGRAHGA